MPSLKFIFRLFEMKSALIISFHLMLILCASCQIKEVSNVTVIKNVTVFDGEEVLLNVNVVFSQDSIVEISRVNTYSKVVTVIDGKDKTLLPPLINAHVHVVDSINLYQAQQEGIFAMLDMFSTDSRANYFRTFNTNQNCALFYSSNVGATVPGGHGTQFGINIPTITDKISPQKFVEDRISEGCDYIKITQEVSMNVLSDSLLSLVIDESKRKGLVTVAHISDFKNAKKLSELGVHGLAHIWYRRDATIRDSNLDIFKENETFIIPTLSVVKRVADTYKEGNRFLSYDEIQSNVDILHDNGITMLAGTDSPNMGLNFTTAYFDELELLQEAGLSNVDVLKAATTNIYHAFELQEFSKLNVGGKSSFILVDGDPLKEIIQIRNSKRIWKNGLELN